jgi:hypothetical protein
MGRITRVAALPAIVLALALPVVAHAAATPATDVSTFQIVSQGMPLCGGEDVVFSGDVRIVSHSTLNAADGAESAFHLNFQNVTATGVTSGSTYHEPEADNFEFTLNGTQSTSSVIINGHLVGSGPNQNTNVQILTKLTVNADGTVTANFDSFRATCY